MSTGDGFEPRVMITKFQSDVDDDDDEDVNDVNDVNDVVAQISTDDRRP